jgi:acyl carrier protein
LPTDGIDTAPAAGADAAPRSATEATLAAIWSCLLNVPRVGRYENFFDLGGDSLLAMQVVSRIWDELRVALPLRRLFSSPTVAELAVAVTQQAARQSDQQLVAKMLNELERPCDRKTRFVSRQENTSHDGP